MPGTICFVPHDCFNNSLLKATEKLSESGSNGRFFYGLAQMQGWRLCESTHERRVQGSLSIPLAMEDAHAAVLDLDGPGEGSNAFFAVYDGHGGVFFFGSTVFVLKS